MNRKESLIETFKIPYGLDQIYEINMVECTIKETLEKILLTPDVKMSSITKAIEETLNNFSKEGILLPFTEREIRSSCKDSSSGVKCTKIKKGKHYKPFYQKERY